MLSRHAGLPAHKAKSNRQREKFKSHGLTSMVAADSVCGRIDDAATEEFTPMATSFSPKQLERFRREAKKLGRDLSITHSDALDRIASRHSFQNWSLLAKHSAAADTPPAPPRVPVSVVTPGVPTERYYLHGDVKADEPRLCYCVRCDLAVEPSHFDGLGYHGDGGDGERYLASLARHNALPSARKAARRRPDGWPHALSQNAPPTRPPAPRFIAGWTDSASAMTSPATSLATSCGTRLSPWASRRERNSRTACPGMASTSCRPSMSSGPSSRPPGTACRSKGAVRRLAARRFTSTDWLRSNRSAVSDFVADSERRAVAERALSQTSSAESNLT